jgi:hypothetical protein
MAHDPHFFFELDGEKIIVIPGPDKTIAELFEYATTFNSVSQQTRALMKAAKIAETTDGDRRKVSGLIFEPGPLLAGPFRWCRWRGEKVEVADRQLQMRRLFVFVGSLEDGHETIGGLLAPAEQLMLASKLYPPAEREIVMGLSDDLLMSIRQSSDTELVRHAGTEDLASVVESNLRLKNSNERLSNVLIALTVALVLFTAPLAFIEIYRFNLQASPADSVNAADAGEEP